MKSDKFCKDYFITNASLFQFNTQSNEIKWDNILLSAIGYDSIDKDITDFNDKLLFINNINKVILSGTFKPFLYELKLKAKNGRWKYLCFLINNIKNTGNYEFNFVGNIFDNSELKKQLKKYENDESRYKAILKIIPDFIFVTNRNHIIEEVYAQPIINSNAEKYIGKTVDDFLPSSISTDIKHITNLAFKSLHVHHTEFTNKINNTDHFFEIRVVKIDNNHVLSIVRDISVKKISEEKNKKNANELIKINETKDKLFSIIGHDLKSPFNNILGFTELLLENFDELEKDKTREYINFINLSARQAFNLLENLLEWSRTQGSKLIVAQQIFDIHKLFERNLTLVYPNLQLKNITVQNKIPKGTIIYADPNMISTVIRNLLNNAIKFTNANGNIELYTIDLDEKNKISIVIKDNGIGMPSDYANKLFKISENITRKGTAGERGSGLGLLLCKDFMDKNDATIQIESAENVGTTFTLTFINSPE